MKKNECPKCGSKELYNFRVASSNIYPEHWIDECEDCGHQFNRKPVEYIDD